MAGAGNEVGKISIRVVPNLEDFHDELNRKLEEEEKKQHKVKIGGNTKPLSRDIDEAVDKPRKAEVGVDFDKSFADRALADLQKNLDALRATGKDISLFEDAAKGLELKIRNVPVEPELVRGWEDDIRLELARMQALSVEIDPDLGGGAKLQAEMAAELAALQTLANLRKIQVPVEVNVDQKRISRYLGSIVGGIAGGIVRLGGSVGTGIANGLYNIGSAAISAGKGFMKLGENGMIAVAVLALIAPALALVSGALVAMPAALAAVAVPMAAVALGMDGIKKAAEVLKPEFEELKKVMSDAFQVKFTPIFESFKGGFADMLKESLPNVTAGLAEFAGGIRDSLTSAEGMSQIENTIDNIGAALGRAKDGARDFASGILTLVSELSNKFPGLADAFNRTGKSFLEWVDKITTKDAVTGVSQLDVAMKSLGDTLSRLGGLATTFFNSGWENLSNADFGKSMSGFVESVDRLVNTTLPALADAFTGIATALKPITATVEAIDAVLNRLGARLPQSADQMSDSLSGLASPNKLLFGDKLGGWIDELTNNEYSAKAQAAGQKLASDVSEGLSQGLSAGGNLGAGLLTNLDDIGPAVSQQIKNAINVSAEDQKQALRSAFTADGVDAAVAQQLTTKITQAIDSAKGAMANLGPELQAQIDNAMLPLATIGDKVGEAFSTMGPAVATAWEGVVTSLTAGTTQISTAVTESFNGLSTSATTAFQGIQNSITGAFGFMVLAIGQQAQNINIAVGQAFTQIPATITTSLSGVVQAFTTAFSGVPAAIGSVLSGVSSAVSSAMNQAAGAAAAGASAILGVLAAGLGSVPAVVNEAFAGMVGVIQAQMGAAVGAVQAGGAQMVAAALSFAGGMREAGVAVGASFAQGILSTSGLVADAASALMATARAFFPNSPADEGPFSGSGWVDKSGESVGAGFAKGMAGSQSEVVATARELMQAVKDIFGTAEGLTLNFNMGPITQSAQEATKSVKQFGDTLSTIPTKQIDAITPDVGSVAPDPARKEELSRQLSLLEQERKSIEIAKSRGEIDAAAAKARLAEIRDQKNILGLEKDKLIYAEKYGDQADASGSKMDDAYKTLTQSAQKMPFDFLKATGQQFMNDVGISGGGLMGAAMDWGTQFVFNVSNVDEAMAVQRNQVAKQGMGVVGSR